jgi:hypothetical protein
VGEGVVEKLREIKPGVWFPSEAEVTAYNKFRIQQEGRRELQWKERYTVERAELDPKYDREFFSKVDFPDGTAVYRVENGEVVQAWRQGAPEAPGGPTAHKAVTRWLLGIGVTVALVLAAAFVMSRKSHAVKAAAGGP